MHSTASSCSLPLIGPTGQLVGTNLPNTNEGQFVDSVEKWVNLYNEFLVSDELPDAGSHVDLLIIMENSKYQTEWLKGFKVRHPCLKTGMKIMYP